MHLLGRCGQSEDDAAEEATPMLIRLPVSDCVCSTVGRVLGYSAGLGGNSYLLPSVENGIRNDLTIVSIVM